MAVKNSRVHKELLYQTEFMRKMLKSVDMDYCKIAILCETVSKEELDVIVKFLYHGEICCSDHNVAVQVSKSLKNLFGFPSKNFRFNGKRLGSELEDSHYNHMVSIFWCFFYGSR